MRTRRKKPRLRWRSSAGFTLVELLVALVLFGFLSLALFGSVRVGATAWIRATAHADESDQSIHAQDLLQHLVENAYPFYVSDDHANRHVVFDGGESGLSFLSVTPLALGRGGRSRVDLLVPHREGRVDLMLEMAPELSTIRQTEKTRQPLLTGASSVTFSYFGKLPSDHAAQWHREWIDRVELPQLIRVAVRFRTSDGREWPDLMVAPRITADVGCVLDRFTTHCEGR
jgi:general secretion pathway protein J